MSDDARTRTSQMTASSAQICRDLGWQPGTRLEAVMTPAELRLRRGPDCEHDDEAEPLKIAIVITAIGESKILARCVLVENREVQREEGIWQLTNRDWERVQ